MGTWRNSECQCEKLSFLCTCLTCGVKAGVAPQSRLANLIYRNPVFNLEMVPFSPRTYRLCFLCIVAGVTCPIVEPDVGNMSSC